MLRVKNVIGYKDVGLHYDVCHNIYEGGTNKDLDGRYLEVGFLDVILHAFLEWAEDAFERNTVRDMIQKLKRYSDDTLVCFD